MDLTIVIPTLNESKNIPSLLASLSGIPKVEVIVCDGGSMDNTLELAKKGGAGTTVARQGRGVQLNEGARLAGGKTLLFLHADSRIAREGVSRVIEAMETKEYIGGAFYLEMDRAGAGLKFIAGVANLRARFFNIVYGDQGIFVDKKYFQELNGFKEMPLMEDYDLFRRMKARGQTVLIEKGLSTSSRRWEKEGIIFTTLRNWFLFTLYQLRVQPFVLKKWYGDIR